MNLVGTCIRESRLSKDISLRQLAKRVGISATYLSHVEVGYAPAPSADILEKISLELGLDVTDLLIKAGKWNTHAADKIGERPALRDLFNLAFAMDESEIRVLITEINDRASSENKEAELL